MKKVLLVATVQSHICQFHRPLAELLHERGYEVHVAARNNLAVKNGLKLDFVDQTFDVPFERSPFRLQNASAYMRLKRIIDAGQYEVIHCNTPVGGILGRLAARKARKRGARVYYTAHGFHFFKGSPRISWLVYYQIEKAMCRHTDKLITINQEDYALAKERFRVKTARLHGVGADEERYHAESRERQLELREKEGLRPEEYVILCTGELNANKDQRTLLEAAAQLRGRIPWLKILLAGNGPLERELRAQIERERLGETVVLLGYRIDLEKVVPAADLIVSCSHREGLPLNIIEGMLCEKPVVATRNRGHNELVEEGETGYLVDPGDSTAMAERIFAVYSDAATARRLGIRGREKALPYTVSSVKVELERIYTEDVP